jgi:alkaline phosphatase D
MFDLRRRMLLQSGLIGLTAGLSPLQAQGLMRGFTHSVASGDPRQTSVILWTRYVGGGDTPLKAEVAEDAEFGRIVATIDTVARADRDFTAKPEATGLAPGRWYFYRFTAPDGTRSDVGRTRTLPEGRTAAFRIAAFSCANFGFGWFNAYAHCAQRNDLDLVVHLGDYIYEYPRGDYPSDRLTSPGRLIFPAVETVTADQYRERYATYRSDPDLQRLHALWPSISIWDDHETSNDAWKDGAQNHQPDTEGTWADRMVAAKRAYYDWMPMREVAYDAAEIGDLATLIRLDTRIEGRDRQLEYGPVMEGATDLPAALAAFRDGPLADPSRSMLGAAQEAWYADTVRASVRKGQRWQLVAQQVLVGRLSTAKDAEPSWLGPTPSERTRARFFAGLAATRAGLPFHLDAWSGYPAARARLLGAAQDAGANLVVLAGDSHNSWAFELENGGRAAGIEFGTPGTTSPGIDGNMRGVAPDRVAASMVATNRELRWCDTSRRGYMVVTLTPEAARCDWTLLDTVRERGVLTARTASWQSRRGTNALTAV